MTTEPYEKIPTPTGTLQEIQVRTAVMANRYRDTQPALNKPSQDTLPNRD